MGLWFVGRRLVPHANKTRIHARADVVDTNLAAFWMNGKPFGMNPPKFVMNR
jgi:hypothetical protein